MIRIWHQSMTTLEELPGYRRQMQEHAARVCDDGTVVDLHGISPGTYPDGVASNELSNLARQLYVEPQIVENVLRAEREGYDAVAMSCFGDPQLDVCRSLVSIPVLSSSENSLRVASTVARAIGIFVPYQATAQRAYQRAVSNGFGPRVAVSSGFDPGLTEYEMDRGFHGDQSLIDRICDHIRGMAASGAEIIIPHEGVLNAVLVHNGIADVDGIPVFDAFGALMASAEMMVKLQRRTGLRNAKTGAYRRPDDAVLRRFRESAIRTFQEAQQRDLETDARSAEIRAAVA